MLFPHSTAGRSVNVARKSPTCSAHVSIVYAMTGLPLPPWPNKSRANTYERNKQQALTVPRNWTDFNLAHLTL
jgi:hypothetical protein